MTESQENTKTAQQVLSVVSIDAQALQDFLKFQGRCYKQPLHTTLAFFGRNPNAEMIQEIRVWERFGCTPKEGATPVLVERNDGTFAEFYDYSQMNGTRPKIWNVDENGLSYIKQKYNIANKYDFGDVLKSLARRDSFTNADICAKSLNLDKTDILSFRNLYNSAVTTALAGRFELGSNFRYTEKLNISEINLWGKLNADNEKFSHFLTSVTGTVNKILFGIEKNLKEGGVQNERKSNAEIRPNMAEVYGNNLSNASTDVKNSEQMEQRGVTSSIAGAETLRNTGNGIRETISETVSELSANGEVGENETVNLRQPSDENGSAEIRNGVNSKQLSLSDLIEEKEEQIKLLQRELLKLKQEQKKQSENIENKESVNSGREKNTVNTSATQPKKRKKNRIPENQMTLFSFNDEITENAEQKTLFDFAEENANETVTETGSVTDNTIPENTVENVISDDIFENIESGNTVKNVISEDVIENIESQKQPKIDNSMNFKITDENLGVGGEKTKFRYNIEAIELVKKLQSEERIATPEEQEILSKYVGFGAISNVFNENKEEWKNERERLKQAVTEEEYRGLSGSTLNAHYTSPTVIEAIYTACESFGIPNNARILEPALGVGNFFGKLPNGLINAKLHGVELDPITSQIAQKLYPSARIENCGFEKCSVKNNSIDLAIGNVPFGSYVIRDSDHKDDWLIHDSFFRKSLDKVASGGIIAYITSKGTLDKKNPEVRQYLAERAELIGAIRLPNNAFKANAGTEVTSDIIFLQKREMPIDVSTKTPDWCFIGETADGIPCNQYFVDNPDMVLGKMAFDGRMYGNNSETSCIPTEGTNLKEQLAQAVSKLSATFAVNKEKAFDEPESETLQAPLNIRNFTICSIGKDFYYKEGSELYKLNVAESNKERLRGILGVREAVRNLIDVQVNGCSDETLTDFQNKLNNVYNRFVARFGALSEKKNKAIFADDDDIHLVMSLEQVNKDTKKIEKADIFYKRTISAESEITSCENVEEAFFVSMDRKGIVDLEYIGFLCNLSADEAKNQLIKLDKIYLDPVSEKYIESAEYLSGNVREKLHLAEISAKENPDLTRNVEALQKTIPPTIQATDISVRMGASWINLDDYARFLNETCGARFNKTFESDTVPKNSYGIQLQKTTGGEFKVKNASSDYFSRSVEMTSTFGTSRINAYQIFENLLN